MNLEGPICGCGECIAAGVSEEPQRRIPPDGRLIHGYELAKWLAARARYQAALKAFRVQDMGPKPLRCREPGEEG